MFRPLSRLTMAAIAVAALAACGIAGAPAATESSSEAEAFPRTVAVPTGDSTDAAEVTIPSEPLRIAALTYETAELVAALGLADRLVVVPAAVTNPTLTNHLADMAAVETTVPTESETDPEQIIALAPDLVLLSNRHGLADGAGRVLEQAGIPVITMPNSWSSAADMVTNVRLVGEATGAYEAAEALAATLEAGLVAAEGIDDAPQVLVLSNQAGRPFVTGGTAFPLELLELAGADDQSDDLGFTSTGPIAAEQVVAADPDAILLIDMNGSGMGMFFELLNNPAVASLDAVAEGKILLVEGRQVQALGIDETIAGLDVLAEWVESLD